MNGPDYRILLSAREIEAIIEENTGPLESRQRAVSRRAQLAQDIARARQYDEEDPGQES